MDALLTTLAESSPVAVVALFAIWRISLVMMVLAEALVQVATSSTENVTEMIEQQTTT